MSINRITYEEEKALHDELLAARAAEAIAERARANKAVSAALASYRWWGWSNICNTVRIAIASWRYKRVHKL